MSEPYEKSFEIRWADLDPHRHLRHSAYVDYATHVRFAFLADHDYTPQRFGALDFGPILFRETTSFYKEVRGGSTITVDFCVGGLAPDASRWRMCHHVVRPDGKRAALIEVEGAWMSLSKRKLTAPDPPIVELFHRLPKTEDYKELDPIR